MNQRHKIFVFEMLLLAESHWPQECKQKYARLTARNKTAAPYKIITRTARRVYPISARDVIGGESFACDVAANASKSTLYSRIRTGTYNVCCADEMFLT